MNDSMHVMISISIYTDLELIEHLLGNIYMQVQKYTVGTNDHCAMAVLPDATSISEHIIRVLPYVHQDESILLCFLGYITNQKDLEAKLDMDLNTNDVGSTTTSLIASLYKSLQADEKKEDLLLAELQVGRVITY